MDEPASFLSHCHGFNIYGGTFNYILGNGTGRSSGPTDDRDSSGLRIVREDEIVPVKQLGQRSGYSLHLADTWGACVVVKVFHGPHANREWEAIKAVSRPLMHPNFLRLLGRSAEESPSRFLVFNGVQESVHHQIASMLRGDLQECIAIGVKVANGLSLGLSYLELQKISLSSLSAEFFDVLISHDGTIILGINPVAHATESNSQLNWVGIFNDLCRMVFREATRALYQDAVERNPPAPADLSALDPMKAEDNSLSVRHYLRRELVWLPPQPGSSLCEIVHQTESFLFRLSSPLASPLPRLRRTAETGTAHHCMGYQREEVVISTRIRTSYIVCSDVPTLDEICTICEERVPEVGSSRNDDYIAAGQDTPPDPCQSSVLPGLYGHFMMSSNDDSDRAIQQCLEKIQMLDIGDATSSALCRIMPEFQPKAEREAPREDEIRHEIQLLLRKLPESSPALEVLLAELTGRLRTKPRYKPAPLILPRPAPPVVHKSENAIRRPKRNSPPGQTLQERREPQPDMDSMFETAFLALEDIFDDFKESKDFNLNPLSSINTSEQQPNLDVNYYDTAYPKASVWFDMSY
ncbi:hypothetical protein DFH07DRAFT_839064 [Mycena maculata]|uniref:Protein kinase domain-containing protein n=1 Tax=Mycena maculata TaxID=230809 RepID=A0AAD7N0M3_9AGAR|nr:hypothetical protein DFH07DRAFT_839064 [Mycena maculata]